MLIIRIDSTMRPRPNNGASLKFPYNLKALKLMQLFSDTV